MVPPLPPALYGFMLLVTTLGSAGFYAPVLLVLVLGVDRRRGLVLALVTLTAGVTNAGLKEAFGIPRPPPETWRTHATGLGFPSGHAQTAAAFWPTAARLWRERWVQVLGLVMVLLVGYSRVWLRVHTWSQVLAGWGFGLAVAAAAWGLEGVLEDAVRRLGVVPRVLVALAAPPLVVLLMTRSLGVGLDAFSWTLTGAASGLGAGWAFEARVLEGGPARGVRAAGFGVLGGLPSLVPLVLLDGAVGGWVTGTVGAAGMLAGAAVAAKR